MPVILTTPAEVDRWLEADTVDALSLQRPLPDDALRIVAKGEKEDRGPEPRDFSLRRIAVSPRAYRAIKASLSPRSVVYPPNATIGISICSG